jgi:hypothetical protein
MTTFTLESNDGSVQIVITATDVAGGVKFDLAVTEGDADMIGFYLDWDGNGGSTFGINSGNGKGKDNGANNMNGADDNGDQITGFDYAYAIGEAGLGNGDTQTASVTVTAADLGLDAFTTADLTDAIVGVRATSTTSDDLGGREGSLKLTGTCDPDEPVDDLVFGPFDKGISNIVIYADCDGNETLGDTITKIKFDSFSGVDCDGDGVVNDGDEIFSLTLSQLYEALGAVGKSDCIILGVTIKAGSNDGGFGPGEGQFFDADPNTGIDTGTTDSVGVDLTYQAAEYQDIWC